MALVLPADGPLELRNVPEPVAGTGQVVLAVACAGICGTDLHIMRGEFPSWPPVILGHEFTGRVSATGPGVDDAWLGQRVVCEPHAGACGQCEVCREGCAQLCPSKRSPGWGVDGAFAPSVAVPAALLHPVPEAMPDQVAVLAEPMAIALSALRRAPVRPGDTVVVTGPGPVGLLAALAARFCGAGAVVVLGHPGHRLDVARSLGFAVDASAVPARGADLLIEASGSAAALASGIELLRVRGRAAAIGLSGQPAIEFPWDAAVRKSLDIAMSMSSSHAAWDPALAVLARYAAEAASLVTAFPLDRWAEAFAAVSRRSVLKAVLLPSSAVKRSTVSPSPPPAPSPQSPSPLLPSPQPLPPQPLPPQPSSPLETDK
jgi:L-iditol 2-dehydrogenase